MSSSKQSLTEKIADIKLLVLDVDGVLTDGGMYFGESGEEFKRFDTKDGRGIIRLKALGIEIAFLSSGLKSVAIQNRAERLGINRVSVSTRPKKEVLTEWMQELNIGPGQVACIGDDVNDLEIIGLAGLSACPADAVEAVKNSVDLILTKKGGKGCVREFIDLFWFED